MKRINSLGVLMDAAITRKAVVIPGTVWNKPKPASVICHLQGITLWKLLSKGIYLYEKGGKHGKGKV
uniref:Uncharacterized protein n=1 Tax=viral metagenome TaxID=1070528 RepID=A0A6H2A3K5_9ZZZZ